jgi:LytS/YehU family sensor histidine kinase
VSLNVYDDVTDVTIAPLLLLPFVENSFKHGASNQLAGGWIRMDVAVQHKWLVVKVDNSKSSEHPKNNHRNGGLGLQNVKKRLELIYPNKYVLHMMDENDTFLVVLRIKLPSLEKGNIEKKDKKSLVDSW